MILIFCVFPLDTFAECVDVRGSYTGWSKVNDKWIYYENGAIVTNRWAKDSVGWCYLGKDGKMLTNEWIMDSQGWCYVGKDGYCITNSWMQDSVGWCYLDENGRAAGAVLRRTGCPYRDGSGCGWRPRDWHKDQPPPRWAGA